MVVKYRSFPRLVLGAALILSFLFCPTSFLRAGGIKESLIAETGINFQPSPKSKGGCGIFIAKIFGKHEFTKVIVKGRRLRSILHPTFLSKSDIAKIPYDPNFRGLKISRHLLYLFAVTLPGFKAGLKPRIVSSRLMELGGYYALAKAPESLALWHLSVSVPALGDSKWVLVPINANLELELENRLYDEFVTSVAAVAQ